MKRRYSSSLVLCFLSTVMLLNACATTKSPRNTAKKHSKAAVATSTRNAVTSPTATTVSAPATPAGTNDSTFDAVDYLTSLSEANVILNNGGTFTDVMDDAKVVESYAGDHARASRMMVAILEYRTKAGKNRRSTTPLADSDDFEGLSRILAQMDAYEDDLKDVKVVSVPVSPGTAFEMKDLNQDALRDVLDTRERSIIDNARKLTPMQEARQQLALLKYFTATQHRDAAYICADNVKRLLAAVHDTTDEASVDQLNHDLETAEGDLRQKMPY